MLFVSDLYSDCIYILYMFYIATIIGIVIAIVVVLLLIVTIVICIVVKKRKRKLQITTTGTHPDEVTPGSPISNNQLNMI